MSATILHEPDIQSLCCDTFWATKTDPAVPRSLDDKHKAWWLGPYFEFCTHLFKDLVEKDAPRYYSAFRQKEIQSALRQLSVPSTTKEAQRTFIRGTCEDRCFHQCTN